MPEVKYTKEQKLIRKQDFLSNDVFKVIAYAGAGKTFMLQRIAKDILNEMPRARVLYLAYNKKIAQEAKTKFPARIRCSTVHGMAYAAVGSKFPIYQMNEASKGQWVSVVPTKYKKGKSKWPFVHSLIGTIKQFLYSGDLYIHEGHVPTPDFMHKLDEFHKEVLQCARGVWEKMQDPSDWFPISHDGYLKMYQMKGIDLGKNYDVILVDEAQDCNGATMGILENATGCSKIWVGDPHQQIYAWRGSINALALVDGKELRLSKSFRFGDNVSNVATHILSRYKNENVPVKGVDIKDKLMLRHNVPKAKPYTYISRTNAELFERAVICTKKGYRHHFVGGWDKTFEDMLMDVFNLEYFNMNEIKSEFFKYFDSVEALKLYAIQAKEGDILRTIKTVETYGGEIPELILKVRNNEVKKERDADVILTTGHKSKGLEWDNVYVAKDFCESIVKARLGEAEHVDDEFNLIYVACTRARKKLNIDMNVAIAIGLVENEEIDMDLYPFVDDPDKLYQ